LTARPGSGPGVSLGLGEGVSLGLGEGGARDPAWLGIIFLTGLLGDNIFGRLLPGTGYNGATMALWENNPKPKKRPRIARRPGTGSSTGVRRTGGSAGGPGASRGGSRSGSGGSGGRSFKSGGKRSIISGGSLRDYPFLRRFYQHQAVISDGLQKFLFLLVIATLIYAFVLGDGGAIKILMLRHKTAELDKEIGRLQANLESLSFDIERLKDDPFYIEKVGREKLGLIKPGDEVIKLVPHDSESRALDE
jgi:cell division protein FtsB